MIPFDECIYEINYFYKTLASNEMKQRMRTHGKILKEKYREVSNANIKKIFEDVKKKFKSNKKKTTKKKTRRKVKNKKKQQPDDRNTHGEEIKLKLIRR